MRSLVLALALLSPVAAGAAPAAPGRKLRTTGDDFRLVFLPGDATPIHQGAFGDATLDVGAMRAQACRGAACMRTVMRRNIRVRIDGGASASRFVRVRAFIANDLPGQRVRLDGRVLTATPQLIDANAPCRVAVSHTLELEVAASMPEGVVGESIQWIVEDVQ